MADAQQTLIPITGTSNLGALSVPLFILRAANMTLATDQQFSKLGAFTKYFIVAGAAELVSGAYGVACLGGVYTAAAKGGSALVAATQSYAGLTGASTLQALTMAAVASTTVFTSIPYLSLTTGNTGALVADVFLWGYVID